MHEFNMIDWRQAVFRKSSRSTTDGNNNCVEVGFLPGVTGMRDSKNPGGPVTAFSHGCFTTFVVAVKVDWFTRT